MRAGDIKGEAGEAVKQQQLREALKAKAKIYSGDVLLVPSVQILAKAICRTTGYLYGTSGTGRATNYEHRLEEATGLHIIHKGGLVLAGEIEEDFKEANHFEIEMLAEKLPPMQIADLIGSLATKLAKEK